jgi:hypothetical protein
MKQRKMIMKLVLLLFFIAIEIAESKAFNPASIESNAPEVPMISKQTASGSEETIEWAKFIIDTVDTYLKVDFGNSIWDATIRVNNGGKCGKEHAIRDWVVKSTGADNVNNYIDACAQRGPLKKADLLHKTATECKFRLEYHQCLNAIVEHILEYTFYPDSNVIKIDYLLYTNWTNIVDLGTPAGKSNSLTSGTTKLLGQDYFIRPLQYHEHSYWNIHDLGIYPDDPKDAGCLNYGGHVIMAVEGAGTSAGFARVLPLRKPGIGGINIIKLLWNRGFENFLATGQAERLPVTSYLYLFNNGINAALETGKNLVKLKTGLTNIEECTSGVSVKNVEVAKKPILTFSPNPVINDVNIHVELKNQADINITVHDITGRSVAILANKKFCTGITAETYNLEKLPKGLYLFKVSVNNHQLQSERFVKII